MPSTPEMMMTTAIDANAAQVVVAGMKMRTSWGTLAPGAEPDAVEEKPRRSSRPEIFLAFPEECMARKSGRRSFLCT
jgi:hypothetical protein